MPHSILRFSDGYKQHEIGLGLVATLVLVGGAWRRWLPLDMTEVLGFVTGGWCVWLTVRENVWNWPIGLANSAFFAVLFWRSHLFADMALQFVYLVLGVLGWYWWLHGGPRRRELSVSRAGTTTLGILLALVIGCTALMTLYLRRVHDAAPFADALTTMLSLAAQYLLTRKLLENWFFWIAADLIYIPLYCAKDLYLTGALYGLFLGLCFVGLREWRRSLAQSEAVALVA